MTPTKNVIVTCPSCQCRSPHSSVGSFEQRVYDGDIDRVAYFTPYTDTQYHILQCLECEHVSFYVRQETNVLEEVFEKQYG